MKALRVGVCLLIAFIGVLGFAGEPGAEVDPLSSVTGLLTQEHRHSRPSSPPVSLVDLEAAALANNPEIRVAIRRVAIAATRVRSAGSLSDPEFMYRGWGTPLAAVGSKPDAAHVHVQPASPVGASGHCAHKWSEGVEQVKAEVEAKKRDVLAQVRKPSTSYSAIRRNSCCTMNRQRSLASRRSPRGSSMWSEAFRSRTC